MQCQVISLLAIFQGNENYLVVFISPLSNMWQVIVSCMVPRARTIPDLTWPDLTWHTIKYLRWIIFTRLKCSTYPPCLPVTGREKWSYAFPKDIMQYQHKLSQPEFELSLAILFSLLWSIEPCALPKFQEN